MTWELWPLYFLAGGLVTSTITALILRKAGGTTSVEFIAGGSAIQHRYI